MMDNTLACIFVRSFKLLLLVLLSSLIAACSSTGTSGRYSQHKDSAPHTLPELIDTQDAIPTQEPHSPINQTPYTIAGITYYPMSPEQSRVFSQQGQASWYGQKFHGHATSNGEIYDMFSMTAAHKTLPLPSFVRVTNLDNGRQAVVRVNDRGPFHSGRIIDLSYAAASKLGYLKTGVANVKIEVLTINQTGHLLVAGSPAVPSISTPLHTAKPDIVSENQAAWFVQVIALQDNQRISSLAAGLKALYQTDVHTPLIDGIHRLRLGPLANESDARELTAMLRADGYEQAFPVLIE